MKPTYRKWLKRHGVPLRVVPSSVSSPFVDVARRTLQPIKPLNTFDPMQSNRYLDQLSIAPSDTPWLKGLLTP